MAKVYLHRQAEKRLNKFTGEDRQKIEKAILVMAKDPYNNALNVKKMASRGRKLYRVRLGDIRILYELVENESAVYIHNIDFRGNVY